MYWHRASKMVYLAHPRTASKATREVLYDRGFENVVDHHSGLEKGTKRASIEVDGGWMIMTAVRNHFDTLVSWQGVKNTETYDCDFGVEYIDKLIETTHRYFPDPHRLFALHLDDATRVLRYETLEKDLNEALEERNHAPVELPEIGASDFREPGDTVEWYDEETRRFVEGLFWQEMKQLNYSWEDVSNG